ncbi:MAG: phenylalanine--tRNA ligase subunit beta [Verrucomicrobiota bacterium]
MVGVRVRLRPGARGAAPLRNPGDPPVLGERPPGAHAVLKVPVSWLREYVPLEMPLEELAERLSVASAEVNALERRGVPDEDGNVGLFRVGRVLEAAKHPNADRLQLCSVDVGEGEPKQIVCGAWNFGPGATVAVALPGAVLPGGLKLEARPLRGTVSHGMILSERELELGPDHSGIIVLPEGEPGTPLVDVLPIVESVFDLEPTGNRPDLLSVYGLAREVSALYGLDLAPWPGRDPDRVGDEVVRVELDDLAASPRYIGRLFRDVRIGPSPMWLRARLTFAGQRPISNVVDVTNYVMLALGSPLHAFDHDTLPGGRILVRHARTGERLRTLDGVERELVSSDLLITDGERPIALAAIMGGEETEVTDATRNVLLEAANFEPVGILRSSERLRLRTEGSNRWEKGVDPHLAEHAARLATELIVELADARWTGHADVHGDLPLPVEVPFRPGRANEVMGLEVPADEQLALLHRLGFAESVVVPTWRLRDVTREIDVVEEVARFHLPEVPFTLPLRRDMHGRLTRLQQVRRRVEDALVGLGFAEVYTPSLVERDERDDALRLPEPISQELAVLRTRLVPSLVRAASRNVDIGAERIALFEVARVCLPRGDDLPDEHVVVAGIGRGGFSRAKGVVEAVCAALHVAARYERTADPLFHPGKAARISAGVLGELHPTLLEGEWAAFELDLGVLTAESRDPIAYEEVIAFPSVRQDLAFVVPEEVEAAALAEAARAAAGPELRELRAFDVFRGEQVGPGRKSIAFSAVFQSAERTLTDEDAAELRSKIVGALGERFGAELRGG